MRQPRPLRPRTGVIRDLLEVVARHADQHVLGDELRGGPIEVRIDAVLILQVRIGRAVGEAADNGEFMSGPTFTL